MLGVAMLLHVLGFALVELAWSAALEIGSHVPSNNHLPKILPNPYDSMIALALGSAKPTAGTIFSFLIITLVECLFAWRLLASVGLDLIIDGVDVRSQGWVFQHIVRPARHGYKPIAYVLTGPAQGEYGLGYEGVIADIRQGDNGEVISISLAEPQRFVYYLMAARPDQPRFEPKLVMQDREWIGGVVVLDKSVVRNIVVHNVPADLIQQVAATDDSHGTPDVAADASA